jgi:hypothetical protein
VDLREVTPVPVRNPTLIADKDPYNSLKPTLKPEPTPEPETQTAENQKTENAPSESQTSSKTPAIAVEPRSEPANQTPESIGPIRKAIPVQPQDTRAVEVRRALPVKPLDQESGEETLLKSATPPPGDLYQ